MTESPRRCRSALYMPANNARALAKIPVLDCDAVIIDLEDSVAPGEKMAARTAAIEMLRAADTQHLRVLRINAGDTPWYTDDLQAVLQSTPDAVLLPKVESAQQLTSLIDALDKAAMPASLRVWAMMESPRAVMDAAGIAAVRDRHQRFEALLLGNNDLGRAAGMPVPPDRAVLLPWIMTLRAAASSHDLMMLDGVYNDFADLAGFTAECEQAVAMGLDGKTLIHPSQVDIANRAFTPDAAAIAAAHAIVNAFAEPANQHAGVLQLDGRMVERLHLELAQRTLRLAGESV